MNNLETNQTKYRPKIKLKRKVKIKNGYQGFYNDILICGQIKYKNKFPFLWFLIVIFCVMPVAIYLTIKLKIQSNSILISLYIASFILSLISTFLTSLIFEKKFTGAKHNLFVYYDKLVFEFNNNFMQINYPCNDLKLKRIDSNIIPSGKHEFSVSDKNINKIYSTTKKAIYDWLNSNISKEHKNK